jgi:endonuclease/exonuclease/phosphatase family metal-dependent hydrolase
MTFSTGSHLRLLTYNIHGCIGKGGRYNAGAIIQILKDVDADFVALQEVYDEKPEDRQFLRALDSLKYQEVEYGITLMHDTRGAYGNIFLSKWPLERVEKIDLSVTGCESRGAIRVLGRAHGVELDITSTHLGLRKSERIIQINQLMKAWDLPSSNPDPNHLFCLMGDLNEWAPGTKGLRLLDTVLGRSIGLRTFPAGFPAFCLDRIYVLPRNQVQKRFVLNNPHSRRASDHLPLVCDIAVGEQ